jgi:hypothetical protein
MIQARTVPGVYIKELNAFPNSIVQVATALPVFIGYTQSNSYQGMALQNKVVEINSLADYMAMFGQGVNPQFAIAPTPAPSQSNPNPKSDVTLNGKSYIVNMQDGSNFYMYNSIQLFFQNGGGTCYVMSIGTYANEGANGPIIDHFMKINGGYTVFDILKSEQYPTMILIPDALLFKKSDDYYTLMNESLDHCSAVQSRMTLIDAYGGSAVTDPLTFAAQSASSADPVSVLRNGVTSAFLNYGAAYYPFVNTNVVTASQITFQNIVGGFASTYYDSDPTINATITKIMAAIPTAASIPSTVSAAQASARIQAGQTAAHNALLNQSPNYGLLMQVMLNKVNCLPATPAVAGCISTVDGSQGVWNAPANVSFNSVQSAVLNIDDDLQSNMNVDAITGKSVNAIRPFPGQGVVIWGARTLEGNSQDWRYISVRRTLIMIEQSVKLAARAYVFQSNDAHTWQNLQSEIENFLTGLWKQGALAGAKPEEAFSVQVGLGSTMTSQDILDGYLDVAILLAVTHPAEFIEITFKQQLQTS